MRIPNNDPKSSNCTSINLPKRELLSFRAVFALPKASRIGSACWTRLLMIAACSSR